MVNLDALTYAGNLENLEGVDQTFVHGDVAELEDVARAFQAAGEGAYVVHFAAGIDFARWPAAPLISRWRRYRL